LRSPDKKERRKEMREYKADPTDLTIKLITTSGEEKVLNGPVLSATAATRIANNWKRIERNNERNKKIFLDIQKVIDETEDQDKAEELIGNQESIHIMDLPEMLATEISIVYDIEPEWLMDNLDFSTLGLVLKDLAEELVRIKKDEGSSTQ